MSTEVEVSNAPKAPWVLNKSIPQDPALINTSWGMVAIFGHELLSKKDMLIIGKILNMAEFKKEYHGVKVIVFREDGFPRNNEGHAVFGNATFDIGGITVNLIHIMTCAMDDAINNPEVSIRATFHRNLLLTLLHEVHHLSSFIEAPKDEEHQQAELDAESWSAEKLIYLAQTTDVEPSHHAEAPFLARQLMELLKEGNDSWSDQQRHMLENNIFFIDPEIEGRKEISINNFKGFVQIMSPEDVITDKVWKNETITGVEGDPYQTAINVASGPQPEIVIPPSSASPNPMALGEDMELGDLDPNNMWDGPEYPAAPTYGEFPVGQPATPVSAVPSAVTTPAYNGFPVANQPAAPAVQQAAVAVVQGSTGMSNEQIAEIVKNLYFRCYSHIFTYCGRLLNSDLGFNDWKNIYIKPIQLTPEEMQVVTKIDCKDVNGHWCQGKPTTDGLLRGSEMKNTCLPYYKLYINMGGQEICRILLPQNPATRDSNGQYKKTAMAARNGSCIMYIKEGNDAVAKASGKSSLLFKITDGKLEAC